MTTCGYLLHDCSSDLESTLASVGPISVGAEPLIQLTGSPVSAALGDAMRLRNAYAHGQPMPDGWDAPSFNSGHHTYAQLLFECTEIVLRACLLKVLSEPALFEVFSDAGSIDEYFASSH
jgi:hypothetical protein